MPEPRPEDSATTAHLHGRGDRLAWTEAADRSAGEGVVVALLPPTRADRQPRYRLCVFRDGAQSPEEIVLPEGVVFPVPRWASEMDREERLHHHSGRTLPWNEQIPGE